MGPVPEADADRSGAYAEPRRADMLRFGLTEEALRRAGLRVHESGDGTGAGLLLPVPGDDGRQLTARFFPSVHPFQTQPRDLGPFGRPECAALEGIKAEERYIAVPFVAPGTVATPRAAIVTCHDLWAVGIAERTGLPVVSTFGDRLLEVAVRRAAELTNGGCIIVAPALGPRFTPHQLRRIVALAGVACREVRIALWSGRDLSAIPGAPLDGTRLALRDERPPLRGRTSPGLPAILRLEGVEAAAAELAGSASRLPLRALLHSATRRPARLGPHAAYLGCCVRLIDEIAKDAAAQGARIAAFGGVAIDLITGGSVRPRKDLDLLVTGGPPDILHRLSLPLEARGFRRLSYRPGEQVVLHGPEVILDLYRLVPNGAGAVTLSTRYTVQQFAADVPFSQSRLGERQVPILDPLLVAAMKLEKLAEMARPYLRNGWRRSADDRADLAALRQRVDFSGIGPLQARGAWWAAPLTPFRFRRPSRAPDP